MLHTLQYPINSYNTLTPDFSSVSLSNDTTIEEALDLVFKSKKRKVLKGERQVLINSVKSVTNCSTVKELRSMSIDLWEQIRMPLVCKIYLKELVLNSQNLSSQEILECDFNNGLNIKFTKLQNKMFSELKHFGFEEKDCIESIIVTGNDGIEAAAQYCLLTKEQRIVEYQRQRNKKKACVAKNRHWKIIEEKIEEKKKDKEYEKMNLSDLNDEIFKLKQKLKNIKKDNNLTQKKINSVKYKNKIMFYKEYLKGIVSSKYQITVGKITNLKRYQSEYGITEKEHKMVLKSLNIKEKDFEKMKTYNDYNGNKNDVDEDRECILCCDEEKNMLIMPCNHICFCEECVEDNYTPFKDKKCPICMKDILDIRKVYL